MTLTLEEPSLVEVQEAELLFKEARQRRRRRRRHWVGGITIGAAAVLVATVLTNGVPAVTGPASHPRPSGSPPAPAPAATIHTGSTIVYAYGGSTSGQLREITADSGASRTVPLPAPYGGSSDLDMLTVGTSLVLSRGNHAWLYPSGLLGPPVDLGPSLRVIPGPTSDEMWIWSDRCAEGLGCSYADTAPQNGVVQLVDSSGRQIGTPIALPVNAHWFPTGQVVDSGMVLEIASGPGPGGAEIWNPTLDHAGPLLTDRIIAARGDVIIAESGTGCRPCRLSMTNLGTGEGRSVRLPTGTRPLGTGSVSPDGSTLALAVSTRAGGTPPVDELAVVNLASGATRVLRGTDLRTNSAGTVPDVTWSDNGWLFAAGVGSTRIVAWRPGQRTAVALPSATLPHVRLDPPQFQVEYPSMIAL